MGDQRMNPDNPSDPLVWDIFENAWVPHSYWRLVNAAVPRMRKDSEGHRRGSVVQTP